MGTYSPSHFTRTSSSSLLSPSSLPPPFSLLLSPSSSSLPCPSQESGTSCSVESEHVWLFSRHNNLSAVVSHLTPGQGRGGGRGERKEGGGKGRRKEEKEGGGGEELTQDSTRFLVSIAFSSFSGSPAFPLPPISPCTVQHNLNALLLLL